MKAQPSIAFNDFAGTAKDVTARKTKGRTVLSVRAKQSGVVTPSQAGVRNSFARIAKAYKQLSDEQMKEWDKLGAKMTSASSLGTSITLTGLNAFLKLNCTRSTIGEDMILDAPSVLSAVPGVSYEDFWLNPSLVYFKGVNEPESDLKMVIKMSKGSSSGVSSSAATFIIEGGTTSDWGDLDLTTAFKDTFGFLPVAGQKYFFEMYWVDSSTGVKGESLTISAVCTDGTTEHDGTYVARKKIKSSDLTEESTVTDMNTEFGPTNLISYDAFLVGNVGYQSATAYLASEIPDNYVGFSYALARSTVENGYRPMSFQIQFMKKSSLYPARVAFYERGGNSVKPSTMNDTGILYK